MPDFDLDSALMADAGELLLSPCCGARLRMVYCLWDSLRQLTSKACCEECYAEFVLDYESDPEIDLGPACSCGRPVRWSGLVTRGGTTPVEAARTFYDIRYCPTCPPEYVAYNLVSGPTSF